MGHRRAHVDMYFRDGRPSRVEITRVQHRLALGERLEDIASSLGRRTEVLEKYLAKVEVHPNEPNRSLVVTTASGARIEGLSLSALIRLARAL